MIMPPRAQAEIAQDLVPAVADRDAAEPGGTGNGDAGEREGESRWGRYYTS